MPEESQKKIGQYELRSVLGKGGMATVWRAYQPSLDREVALKLMAAQFSEEESFTKRFNQEARSIARLRHPNILTIYEFGEESGQPFIVTELLDGGTLRDFMRQPLDMKQISRILSQVADALDYAHAQGMVHRDIKPSNILMGTQRVFGDRAVLGDFGIVKLLSNTHLTQTGVGIGTPEYMSPEQASGEPLDGRSDEYSLGIVLYELLTGVTPFKADTPLAVLMGHVNRALPDPRTFRPDLSPEVVGVLKKALAKFPQERYDSAGQFAEAFAQAVANQIMPSVMAPNSGATEVASPTAPRPPTSSQQLPPVPTGPLTAARPRDGGPVLTSAIAYEFAMQQEAKGNSQAAFETLTDLYKREPNYRDVATRIQNYQAKNFQYTGAHTLFRSVPPVTSEEAETRAVGAEEFKRATQVGPYIPKDPTHQRQAVPNAGQPSGPSSPPTIPGAGTGITPATKKNNGILIGAGIGAAALVVAAIVLIVVLANGTNPANPTATAQASVITPTVPGATTAAVTTASATTPASTTAAATTTPAATTPATTTAAPTKADPASSQILPVVNELYKAKGTASLKDSVQKLKDIATNNKDSWLAQRELGRAYYWYVRDQGGLPYLKQAILLNPDDAISYAYLAIAYFDTFDDTQALSTVQEAIRRDPNSAEVQAAYAIASLRANPSRAKQTAQDALKIDPNNILANWAAWASYLSTREFGTALQYIQKLVDNYPNFASFASGYGDHFQLQGDDANATTWYNNALKIDPDFPQAHSGLAQIARLKNDFDTAIKEYQKAISVYSIDPNAHIGLGYAYDAKGQSEQARAEFNNALKLDRNSAAAYNGLAFSYINQANASKSNKSVFNDFLNQAVNQADQAIQLANGYADAYFQKGYALFLLQKYTEAEAPLKRATDLEKNNPNYYTVQAYNLAQLQKKDEAKQAAQAALKLDPNAQQAKDLLKQLGG
jgi:serine/threonine-protein kinase